MLIEIYTYDTQQTMTLDATLRTGVDQNNQAPGGATILFKGITLTETVGAGDILVLIANFASQATLSIGTSLFSATFLKK